MMSERFEYYGVTLTDDECREVLRWVREPWRPMPDRLTMRSLIESRCGLFIIGDGVPGRPDRARLTPALIDAIRNHVTPWTEVRRNEVKPGEVFRDMDDEWIALCGHTWGSCGRWVGASLRGTVRHICSDGALVLVRRPRKRTLTLGEVEPGQRFRFQGSEGYVHLRTAQGWLEEATWSHASAGDSCSHRPVILVEEPGDE